MTEYRMTGRHLPMVDLTLLEANGQRYC